MEKCISTKPSLKIGQIGTGYIGKTHAIAYSAAPSVFELSADIKLSALADIDAERVKQKAQAWGFGRYTTDWKAIIEDPEIDIVDICTPNYLHEEMALAAMAAGKAIYMEKPLALTYASAKKLADIAAENHIKTLVGFNYMRNTAVQYIKQLIDTNVIGDVVQFRGQHNEDYMASADVPAGWRTERKKGGSGALGDLGAHIINMAQFLVGDIDRVCGMTQQVFAQRPVFENPALGSECGGGHTTKRMADVENEDVAYALVQFANGARGTLEASRVAWGAKLGLCFEVIGTKGAIRYDQERLSEIQLYLAQDETAQQGFKTILMGPAHPDYENFCVASGHGMGFNDMKIIEIRDLIEGVMGKRILWPDFAAAASVNAVMEAIEISDKEKQWVDISALG